MTFVDFSELKTRVSFDQVVHMLGLKLKGGRTECPQCGGGPRTLAITPHKGFYCFKANKGGADHIALVAHINGCGMREAAEMIAHNVSLPFPTPLGLTKARTRTE